MRTKTLSSLLFRTPAMACAALLAGLLALPLAAEQPEGEPARDDAQAAGSEAPEEIAERPEEDAEPRETEDAPPPEETDEGGRDGEESAPTDADERSPPEPEKSEEKMAEAPPPAPEQPRAARVRRARGFAFRLDAGQAMWSLDGERIAGQVGEHSAEVRPLLVENTPDAPALTLHIGYNVLGHATVGAELCGTGWNLFDSGRGGGGLAAATIAWHPAELLAELLPIGLLRQRTWDASLFGGAGWGAVGKERALRGAHYVFGARAEIYLASWFTVGASIRHYTLRFDEYVVHWDHDESVALPDTSGGTLLVPGISVTMRVPTGG